MAVLNRVSLLEAPPAPSLGSPSLAPPPPPHQKSQKPPSPPPPLTSKSPVLQILDSGSATEVRRVRGGTGPCGSVCRRAPRDPVKVSVNRRGLWACPQRLPPHSHVTSQCWGQGRIGIKKNCKEEVPPGPPPTSPPSNAGERLSWTTGNFFESHSPPGINYQQPTRVHQELPAMIQSPPGSNNKHPEPTRK